MPLSLIRTKVIEQNYIQNSFKPTKMNMGIFKNVVPTAIIALMVAAHFMAGMKKTSLVQQQGY